MFRKGKKHYSSSSSQSSEISTKNKLVDSNLGGLSRSSTVASLDTDSTKSSGMDGGGVIYHLGLLTEVHLVLPEWTRSS